MKGRGGHGKAKVIVVGAGPVGLATALTLHKRNIPVEVVERDDRPGTHSYALALHPGTVAQLREWDLLNAFEGNSIRVDELVFRDKSGSQFNLNLLELPGYQEGLLVVGQNHLEDALVTPLEKAKVPILWNHRLGGLKMDESGVKIELERLSEGMSGYAMARLEWQVDSEFAHEGQYLIGADGHFSMVRRKLGIEFPKVAPTQSFAVFEFRSDFDHGNKAHVVFTDQGTNILWPLPGGYCRWCFGIEENEADQYSRDKDRLFVQIGAHGFSILEERMLHKLIEERAPWFNGSVGHFRWRMIVRFEKRLAANFGNNRAWLAGDAGHMAAPIGMQSMNVGIKEGHRLANTIADIIEDKAGPKKLEAYALDRQREWRTLLGLDTRLGNTDETPSVLAPYATRILDCFPGSLESLPAFASLMGMSLLERSPDQTG